MWHDKAAQVPDSVKAEYEAETGKTTPDFWLLAFGGRHEFTVSLFKEGSAGDVWSMLVYDDTCDSEVRRFVGPEVAIQAAVDTVVQHLGLQGVVPVDIETVP